MALQRRTMPDGGDITDVDLNDITTNNGEEVTRGRRRPAWLTKAFTSTLLYDLKAERTKLGAFELFERFNQAVGLRYAGDSLTAGIYTSCISCRPGDKPMYYAAVHRFPPGEGRQKRVVASWKDTTLEAVVRALVDIWLEALKTEGPDGSTTEGSPFGKRPEGRVPAAHVDLTDLLEQSIKNSRKP